MPPEPALRRSPEKLVAILLVSLAAPMAVPVASKLLGANTGFLRDLCFFSGASGTPLVWFLALAISLGYISFAVRNVPPVARSWRNPS